MPIAITLTEGVLPRAAEPEASKRIGELRGKSHPPTDAQTEIEDHHHD